MNQIIGSIALILAVFIPLCRTHSIPYSFLVSLSTWGVCAFIYVYVAPFVQKLL